MTTIATQELVTRVPEASQSEMKEAVDAASKAFETWGKTSVVTRQRVMLKLQQLIRDNEVTDNNYLLLADLGIATKRNRDTGHPQRTCLCHPSEKLELAKSITVENGKTLADAKGDVFRGL
eukprot:1395206-Amorphochlora_amoeboformis.AAC.1